MSNVMACIGGSHESNAVVEAAAWATQTLNAPLTLLHVLNREHYPVAGDLSGNIGLGSREHLLDELAALDEKRSQMALEQGLGLLAIAKNMAAEKGISYCELKQRHGNLFDVLQEIENKVRLLVIGKSAQSISSAAQHIGSQLESVIRIMHRPILIVPTDIVPKDTVDNTQAFIIPQAALLAFDGSATGRKSVEMLARSPLCKGMDLHIVMVGPSTDSAKAQLAWAEQCLNDSDFKTSAKIIAGDVEATLHQYRQQHSIGLLVMGAYGHSRIRQFFVGSTTNKMLSTTHSAVLLLR